MRLHKCLPGLPLIALALAPAVMHAQQPQDATAAVDRWTQRVEANKQPPLLTLFGKAAALPVEELACPIKTTNLWWYNELVPNPDGKSYDLIKYYYKAYRGPHTLVIADLGTGTVDVRPGAIPDGYFALAAGRTIGRDGKLYLASAGLQDVRIFVYDPSLNTFSPTKMVLPGIGDATPITLATDGRMYVIGVDSRAERGSVFQIDPVKEEVVSLGHIGPSAQYTNGIAADADYLYIVTRKGGRTLTSYNLKTKEEKQLLATTPEGNIQMLQKRNGCEVQGSAFVGLPAGQRSFWLYAGKAIEHPERDRQAPWSELDKTNPAKPLPPAPEFLTDSFTPDAEGNAQIGYRFTKDEEWKKLSFKVPLFPSRTHRLTALADGRLFGKCENYDGEFLFDPKTGEARHLSRSGIEFSSAMARQGDKVYVGGYSSARMCVYDLSRPVAFRNAPDVDAAPLPEAKDNNPRFLSILRRADKCNMHQVVAALAADDGKVYFAGNSYRDSNRGALAWWDPQKETAGGIWQPFSNVAFSYMTGIGGGKLLVLSTFPKPDTELGKPTPKQAKLIVYEPATGKVVREIEPVESSPWTGMIVGLDDRRVIGLALDPANKAMGILYGVDAVAGRTLWRKPFPLPDDNTYRPRSSQAHHRWDFYPGPDGKLYLGVVGRLVRLDPENASFEVLGSVAGGVEGDIAFVGDDLYMSGMEAIRRIKGGAKLRGVRE